MCQFIYVTNIVLIVFIIQCNSEHGHKKKTVNDLENDVQDYDSSQQETENLDVANEVSKKFNSRQELEVISKEVPVFEKTTAKNFNRKIMKFQPTVIANNATLMTTSKSIPCNQKNISSEEIDQQSKSTLVDYPFSVSIQKKGAHYVSGALIDKRWILSVAGEFFTVRESIKLFRARLGSVDCKRGGTIVPIKKVEIHPYYVHGKPNFDVALLRMAMPVDFTDVIRPIGISNIKGKIISAKFMTTYWPRVMVKGQLMPRTAKERIKYNSMRLSTQKLIPIDKCIKVMRSLDEVLNESSICLKPIMAHHSICMPDAGAPVIAEDGLWGITSGWISPTCPNYTAPTIFTRLSSPSVRSWLDTQLLNI